MVKSMTGFGRFELADENKKITVEIKSVNHRYLDMNLKMPKKLNVLQKKVFILIQALVNKKLS